MTKGVRTIVSAMRRRAARISSIEIGRTASRWLAKVFPHHVRCEDERTKVLQCRIAINESGGGAAASGTGGAGDLSAARGIAGERGVNRLLVVLGALFLAAGILWPWIRRLPLFRLPGDIVVDRPGFKFFFPITTSSS